MRRIAPIKKVLCLTTIPIAVSAWGLVASATPSAAHPARRIANLPNPLAIQAAVTEKLITRYLKAVNATNVGNYLRSVAAAQAAAAQAAQAAAERSQAAQQAAPVTTSPAPAPASGLIQAWSRVATCEEGGQDSPTYGYYGILPGTWAAYGGTQYAATAGGATQSEQVQIANEINGGVVPDANGCGNW